MLESHDPWHFARAELARNYLALLGIGINHSLTLFSERRTGKTTFLLGDLRPAAAAAGYLPIYIDFWEQRGDACETLVSALDQTLQDLSKPRSAIGQLLKTPVTSVGLLEFKVDFGELAEVKRPSATLLQVRWLLTAILRKSRRPLLLLLDEFQQIVEDPRGDALAASLRSGVQQLAPAVRVVFSGSSETRLSEMFKRTRAPLYDFSSHVAFPKLGREFVDFIAGKFQSVTRRKLPREALWSAFTKLDQQPRAFKDLVFGLIKSESTEIEQLLRVQVQAQELERNLEVSEALDGLRPLDRLVLDAIAEGQPPTGSGNRAAYAKALGVAQVYPNSVQLVLAKLLKRELITRWADGSYRVSQSRLWRSINEASEPKRTGRVRKGAL